MDMNMTEPLHHTGKVVSGDSGFCVAQGVTALHQHEVHGQFLIKMRRYWPKHVSAILNRATQARVLLSPQWRQCQGGEGQRQRRRQRRDPQRPREQRRTRQRKRTSHNDGQSAGLRKARVPAPMGGGEVVEQRNGDG